MTVASHDWVCLFSDARHGSELETLLARCVGWDPTLVIIEALTNPSDPKESGNDKASFSETPDPDSSASRSAADKVKAFARGKHCAAAFGQNATRMSGQRLKSRDREDDTVVFGGFASGSMWRNMGRTFAGDGRSFIFAFDGGGSGGPRGGLRVLEWAGSKSNRSFMTCDERVGLGMGAGGSSGSFGLFVGTDLRKASSGPCETFGNKPLLSSGSTDMLEVIGIEVWGFTVAKVPKGMLDQLVL